MRPHTLQDDAIEICDPGKSVFIALDFIVETRKSFGIWLDNVNLNVGTPTVKMVGRN